MKKFMIAVNSGINFSFAYIKIDNFDNPNPEFYLELIKNAFPSREYVNKMLAEYRKASSKTLYSSPDLESLIAKKNNNADVICLLVYDASNEWRIVNE